MPFSNFWNFYRRKCSEVNSGGKQFWKRSELFGPPLLYFNIKRFKDPNSLSFIRLQCILLDSGVPSSGFWNFYKLKRGGPNLWGKQILEKIWIIWYPQLYFKFQNLNNPNSSSCIRFQCILLDWVVPFSNVWNFCKLKRGRANFCGEPVLDKV